MNGRLAMKSATRLLTYIGVFTAMLVGIRTANAGLSGSTLAFQYYAYGESYRDLQTFLVDGSIERTFRGEGRSPTLFNIVIDDTSISFDYSSYNGGGTSVWGESELSLPPTVYNGVAIDLVDGARFDLISINPETNMAGFDPSRFSFTKRQLQLDWMHLEFSNTTFVKFDVVTVPEPSTLALFGGMALTLFLAAPRTANRAPTLARKA